MAVRGIGLALAVCCAALAQTAGSPEFEAVVIKPAAPQQMGRMMIRMGGGPGTQDPGHLNYTNISIKQIIQNAYGVRSFQISGPDYMDSQRFDITGKVPYGATKEQFKLMLQNMLATRFGLKLHHETKELPVMALVVAKNGPKMKESAPEPEVKDGEAPPKADMAPPKRGPDGMPVMRAGQRGNMMMVMNGRFRMQSSGQTMSQLCEMLSNQLGEPVEDATGLTKKYDFTLDFAPEMGKGGMPMPMQMPDGPGGGGGPMAGASDSGPTLEAAVQEQLGLKLERRKGQADFLVIEHVERTPTEN